METALRIDDTSKSGAVRLPYGYDYFSGTAPDGSSWSHGRGSNGVPADFSAWAWQWSLEWFTDSLEGLLREKILILPDCEPFVNERQWALVRAVTETSTNLRHDPVPLAATLASVRNLLTALAHHQVRYVRIGAAKGLVTDANELSSLAARLDSMMQGGITLLHRPYPVPDNVVSGRGYFVDHLYTRDSLRLLVEQVHSSALVIYSDLVDSYFPALRSTLGLACIMPVALRGELQITEDSGAMLRYAMEPARPEQRPYADIQLSEGSPKGLFDFGDFETLQGEAERYHRMWSAARPDTGGWARPHRGNKNVWVFGDMPAIYQAYSWLWGDLKVLHLVDKLLPSGESW